MPLSRLGRKGRAIASKGGPRGLGGAKDCDGGCDRQHPEDRFVFHAHDCTGSSRLEGKHCLPTVLLHLARVVLCSIIETHAAIIDFRSCPAGWTASFRHPLLRADRDTDSHPACGRTTAIRCHCSLPPLLGAVLARLRLQLLPA